MKILNKVKLILLIILIGVVIALNSMQNYYQKQDIEYMNWMTITTIVVTWLVLPIYALTFYNGVIRSKIVDKKVVAASMLGSGLMYVIVFIFFQCRIGFYYLFESRNETKLDNGLIMVECESFGVDQTYYYEPINSFLYKRVDR